MDEFRIEHWDEKFCTSRETIPYMKQHRGRILKWDTQKGFGFIEQAETHKHYFFHRNECRQGLGTPACGVEVQFHRSRDSKGRSCATDVNWKSRPKKQGHRLPYYIAGFFLAWVAIAAYTESVSQWFLPLYLLNSLLTFSLYARDKKAARDHEWRISEKTLILFALLGGWPGALLAQIRLRHKTKKGSFQVVFWSVVLLNSCFFAWAHTA